jgi:hypothetical protein
METIATDQGNAPVYHAGALAYLDSFAGMLPVTVTEIIAPGYGWCVAGGPNVGEIRVRLHVTRGGYTRGEIITRTAHNVVPRPQHHYRSGLCRINPFYAWR